MKKKILLIVTAALLFLGAGAQTVTIEIEESDGGCGQASDCEANIACFDLIITVDEPDWALSSYNVWTQYPAPPVMSYFSDDACITQNGGDTDDNLNGQYRVAGVTGTGTYVLEPNTPTIFHNVCYSYSDELDLQDSIVASGGTLMVYGTPFFTTVTLVNQISNVTAGLTIPQQEFLTLNSSTFTCLNPDFTIEKVLTSNADNDGSGTISLGDVLTYTITATNTGFIPQENVIVSDLLLTPAQSICAILEVGETCVLEGTYVVTQDDVNAGEIVNTGTVVSDDAGPFTDELITPVPNNPDMTIEKTLITDISGGVSVGDVLNYTVEVVNTGNMTLNNVVVSDPKLSPSTTTCEILTPGSSCILNGVYFVQQADMNTGEIINVATGISDETPEISDEVITTLPTFADIAIDKQLLTDVSGGVEVGDVLVYNIELLNSGNVTLHNASIVDAMITPSVKTCPELEPGFVCTLTGTYIVQQSDIDAGIIENTATGNSDETNSEIDQVIIPVDQLPDLSTEKTLLSDVSDGVMAGDDITYEVVVTNTGNITLTNVTVSDVLLTPTSVTCPTLAPDDQCVLTGTYTVTQNDIDLGYITNTGIGDADETDPVPDEITSPLPAAPEIETTKTLVSDISGGISVGDVLVYTVEVENVGGITLHNVSVTDDKLNPGSNSCATLLPGNVCSLTGTYTVTQDDLDAGQIINEGIGDSDETEPESDILTTPVPQEPEIVTAKTLLTDISGGVSVGDDIIYQVDVTNTGNITLHNVVVTDDKLAPNESSCAILAPGSTCTLIGTYTVTQADKDAGVIVNEGIGDSDETDPVPEEITTPLDQNPELETAKTLITDVSGGVEVGDALIYQVVVTNIGDVTLNNVVVTDDKLTPTESSCATLAPGSACILTGEYIVTQADKDAGEIINQGIGDADETDPVPDEITTPLDQNPDLLTAKTLLTDISGGVDVGDEITYQVVVTNTGDITLNNVTVEDVLLTPSLSSCAILAPGSACTLTGTYTVTQADKDAGFILNTGIGDADETDPDPDELNTPLDQNPEIATVKTLDTDVSGGIAVGDQLTYTVKVTNTGDITLHNVSVTDVKLTPNNANCPELAVGESCMLTGTYTVTQADKDAGIILNTGIGDSDETDPDSDELSTGIDQNPALVTTKTLETDISGGVIAGDILTYNVVVANTGDITLTGVTVSDPMISPNSKGCPALLPGETCVLTGTYVVTQADIQAGQIVNTGNGDSNETPPDSDEITTTLPQETDFDITKQLLTDVSGGIEVDDILTYQIVVTNTGNMILNNVVVSDPMLTPASSSCATLVPGGTCVLTGSYQVVQSDIDAGEIVNIATGDTDETEPKTDQLITPIDNINPDIAIQKTMITDISGGVNIGDDLEYEVVVTNTGNITLNNVFVTDPMLTPGQAYCATVAPGATCTLNGFYTLTLDDLNAGFVDNTATGNSDQAGPVEDQLTTPLEQVPEITTVKTMITDISGGLQAGDELTYQVEVTNSGNITIHNVTVTDPMLNPGFTSCAVLDPGEICTLTGNYTVTLDDLNLGTITNTGIGDSDETEPDDDEITTTLPQDPELNIVKTLLTDVTGGVEVGDEITYQVDVTNIGNITLNNVEVSDPMLTPATNSCPTLEPGETCTLTGTYVIQQSDLDAGEIVNTASGDSDETEEVTDQLTTAIPVGPEIETTKTLLTDVSGGIAVGDQLIYHVQVANIGNVTLTNVTISDPMLTPDFASCVSVPPGEICTLTGSYIVTQEDKDAGVIINTATGNSDQTEPLADVLETPVDQNPETTTVKTLLTDVSGGVFVGDILTYRVEVINSGDITLHNVSVTDVKLDPNNKECAELAPGESCVLTGTYEVTQADKDAGFILNTGIGDSDETDPDPDVLNTPIDQDPQMEIVKALLTDISGGVFAGDILTYQVDVTNTGDVTLTNVLVSDPMISPNQSGCPELPIGETCTLTGTYTLTQADIQAGFVANTATGDADETDPVSDNLTIPLNQDFLIDIEKVLVTDVSAGLAVGDVLTYEVDVTNTGNMILNNVVVDDPMLTPASKGCPTLVPGATCTLVGIYQVTQADMDAGQIVNTASGNSDETDEVTDQVTTPINNQNPDFTIVKTLITDISAGVFAGDELTYEVVVTNTGNITLTNVLVEDDKISPASTSCPAVAPGETCTLTGVYTLTQDDINAGFVMNTGTGNSDQVGPDTDELNTPLEQNPEITTTKTLITDISDNVFAGDELTYTVEVENTGNLILTNVTVSDTKITPDFSSCAMLNPGEVCTLTGTYIVTQDDIDAGVIENTGTGDSDQTGPDSDELTTPIFTGPEIVAVDDSGDPVNSFDGGVSYANVLVNDLLGTDPVDPVEVTMVQISSTHPGITLDEVTGEVSVAPGTPAGDYELVYELCEIANPTNCDQATVTVPVVAPEIIANDDAGDPVNGFVGGTSFTGVLTNDLLNGAPVDPTEITLTEISATHPGVTLNPVTGEVNVAPGTPAGNYELVYEICEILNPDNCDQATVTVPVTAPEIIANDDNGGPVNGYEGGVGVADVLVNDLLNGDPVDPADVTLTEISSEDPGVTLDPATGEVNVAPGTPAGSYELVYEICEIINPANCDQAIVTIEVVAPEIIANDDSGGPINGYEGGVGVADVLVDDLLNGFAVDPADITLSQISTEDPGVTLDPLTGEVTVAAGTAAGIYELVYEICEVVNPTNCDQAVVTIEVVAPEIIANDDSGNAINGVVGGVSFDDVLVNDFLNGSVVDPADITLTEISSTHPGVSIDPLTGEVIVAPGTPAGNYELVYEICEILNPTNCDQATVTVPVFVEPVLEFCFNGDEAVNGNTLFFCSTEEIAFTLCEIVEGQAPFSICWEVDGAPDCELIVNLGDTLFVDFFNPGTYNVHITSITDDLGTAVADLSGYNFTIEVVTGPEAFAGSDAVICENTSYPLSAATASNYTALQWTGGDGEFLPSAQTLNPEYVPGPQDMLDGTVELCLAAMPLDPCTTEFTDCLTLTIQPNAVADAGADVSVCVTDGFVELNGMVENGAAAWSATVPTGGFFEDANIASTKYFFSVQDIQLGTIELCLTSTANEPCFIPDTDCLNVTIIQTPVANAGDDKSVCEGDDVLLDDAIIENADEVLWSSDGDGTFADPTQLITSYTPGIADIAAGGAQLCLTAYPLSVCSDISINCLSLVIFKAPAADLGPDRELVCDDYDVDNGEWLPVNFDNNITGDYQSVMWTTSGDGTFDDPAAVNPNYYPGLSDIWDGDVEICINIQAAGNCQFNVTQCVTVYIPQQLIYFHKDGWWGISSYLDTDLPTVPEVMDPLVLIPGSQHLINMVDKQGSYFWPEPVPPQSTLGDWEPIGYKLKMKNTPACLPIYGDSLIDQTFEVNGSFTYLPTLTNVPVDVETLFEGHVDDVLLIFHWAANELWTPEASDFDSIYPGYAYLLVNKIGAGDYTIEYPDFVPDASHLYPVQVPVKDAWINNSPWEDVQNTALPHIFMFDDIALNRLQPGDILGAFNNSGDCYGMAEYGNAEAIFKLVAMGADNITEDSRGFDAGNEIQFRIFNKNTGIETEVEFIFDENFPSFDGTFSANSVSMVKDIMKSATSIGEVSGEHYEINLYPNPATDMLNIVSNESISEITITNSVGQVVYREQSGSISAAVNVSGLNKGLYFVTVHHENDRVTIKRVTIQ